MRFLHRNSPGYGKAKRRLQRVKTAQVQEWAEQTLWATQQGLDGYRVTDDPAALEEAYRGCIGLLAAIDVMKERPHLT